MEAVAILLIAARLAWGAVELSVEEPRGGFSTFNDAFLLVALVSSTVEGDGLISISNSAGMGRPPGSDLPLKGILIRFPSPVEIKGLLIRPRIEGSRSFGPRSVLISFSKDGEAFSAPVRFNVPSGVLSEGTASIELEGQVVASFVRIEVLEGWQREGVSIEGVSALDPSGRVKRGLIASAWFECRLGREPLRFRTVVPLMEGENRVTVSARLLRPPPGLSEEEVEDFDAVEVMRLRELPPKMEGPIELSDGGRLTVAIAPGSAEGIERIEIRRAEPGVLPPPEDGELVEAYEFRGLVRRPFSAEATSYLETQPPFLAVDGDHDPRSTWITAVTPMPVEITVDLTAVWRVGSIVVYTPVVDGQPYGPERAEVLVSIDGRNFAKAAEQAGFGDEVTTIRLPEPVEARFVKLRILEGKQPNNVRITEIEFRDEFGSPIVPYMELSRVPLRRPAVLSFRISPDEAVPQRLAFLVWNEGLGRWEVLGGELVERGAVLVAETTYLSRIGVARLERELPPPEPRWSFNPFSPNGDGVADRTSITIRLGAGEGGELTAQIFDLSGKLVRTLVDREPIPSGSITIEWDGRDEDGRLVPVGAYIYQIRFGKRRISGVIAVAR